MLAAKSDMASPIVCVLKGENGKDGVRIAIHYRYLNKFCVGDAYPTPDIGDIIQKVLTWLSLIRMRKKDQLLLLAKS